jgi:hypothetical protein
MSRNDSHSSSTSGDSSFSSDSTIVRSISDGFIVVSVSFRE